jgi:DNA-directed RNA polymerase specialized sigma24 family protein
MDQESLAAHVERDKDRLLRCAWRITGNYADACDVIQDATIKALSNLHELDDRGAVGGWLMRIVRNTALTVRRDRLRRRDFNLPMPLDAVGRQTGTDADPAVATTNPLYVIAEMIDGAPPAKRALIIARLIATKDGGEAADHSRMAALLRKSPHAVRAALNKLPCWASRQQPEALREDAKAAGLRATVGSLLRLHWACVDQVCKDSFSLIRSGVQAREEHDARVIGYHDAFDSSVRNFGFPLKSVGIALQLHGFRGRRLLDTEGEHRPIIDASDAFRAGRFQALQGTPEETLPHYVRAWLTVRGGAAQNELEELALRRFRRSALRRIVLCLRHGDIGEREIVPLLEAD